MSGEHVKGHIVEGLFRYGVAHRMTPLMRLELARLGIDPSKKADCPRAKWDEALELCARHLYPSTPMDIALCQLGQDTVSGLLYGAMWGLMAHAAPVMGPEMMLKGTPKMFSTGDNYTRVSVSQLAPRDYRLTFSGQHLAYCRGLLIGSLAATKASDVKVELVGTPVAGVGTFKVSWGES